MIFRRKFLKTLAISFLGFLSLPYKLLYSASKKILNPDLSDQQKDIMFNEGTERALQVIYLKKIEMDTIIVPTVGLNYLLQIQNLIVGLDGHHLLPHYPVHLRQKLIIHTEWKE